MRVYTCVYIGVYVWDPHCGCMRVLVWCVCVRMAVYVCKHMLDTQYVCGYVWMCVDVCRCVNMPIRTYSAPVIVSHFLIIKLATNIIISL